MTPSKAARAILDDCLDRCVIKWAFREAIESMGKEAFNADVLATLERIIERVRRAGAREALEKRHNCHVCYGEGVVSANEPDDPDAMDPCPECGIQAQSGEVTK